MHTCGSSFRVYTILISGVFTRKAISWSASHLNENDTLLWARMRLRRFQKWRTCTNHISTLNIFTVLFRYINELKIHLKYVHCHKFETKLLLIANTIWENLRRVKVHSHGDLWKGSCDAAPKSKNALCAFQIKFHATSFSLGVILQKWADDQFSFITKESIYYINYYTTIIQLFSIGVDWSENCTFNESICYAL